MREKPEFWRVDLMMMIPKDELTDKGAVTDYLAEIIPDFWTATITTYKEDEDAEDDGGTGSSDDSALREP